MVFDVSHVEPSLSSQRRGKRQGRHHEEGSTSERSTHANTSGHLDEETKRAPKKFPDR